jgi:hypothetical protein
MATRDPDILGAVTTGTVTTGGTSYYPWPESHVKTITDEGLDVILGQWPKNATRETTSNLCLFTSQTASTVIAHTAAAREHHGDDVHELRVARALATATWGAQSEYSTTLGRQTTYPQVTFPTVGATGATINGFYITNGANTSASARRTSRTRRRLCSQLTM